MSDVERWKTIAENAIRHAQNGDEFYCDEQCKLGEALKEAAERVRVLEGLHANAWKMAEEQANRAEKAEARLKLADVWAAAQENYYRFPGADTSDRLQDAYRAYRAAREPVG